MDSTLKYYRQIYHLNKIFVYFDAYNTTRNLILLKQVWLSIDNFSFDDIFL